MKKIIFTLLVSFSGLIVLAQHEGHDHAKPAPVQNKAVVVADTAIYLSELIHDFGKIPQGKPVHHNFTVTNQGKTGLKIDNVQASCGCTTPEWEKDKTLAPGESTTIKVGYNAAAEGPFNKSITITYNTDQVKQLNIKGEVWKTPASSAPANAALEGLKEK